MTRIRPAHDADRLESQPAPSRELGMRIGPGVREPPQAPAFAFVDRLERVPERRRHPGLDLDDAHRAVVDRDDVEFALRLDEAQRVIEALQATIGRYGGTIVRIAVDDKGPTVLAAFGLPPLSMYDSRRCTR